MAQDTNPRTADEPGALIVESGPEYTDWNEAAEFVHGLVCNARSAAGMFFQSLTNACSPSSAILLASSAALGMPLMRSSSLRLIA